MRANTFTVALLVLGSCLACGPAPVRTGSALAAPKAVVLITVEAFRPDLLSTYGGSVAMPNLDRLASRGVMFEDATTPCPMSRPSLAAIMTGLVPDRSGVRDDVRDRLPRDTATVAGLFKGKGYETAAFVPTPFGSYFAGFDRGFGLFDGPDDVAVGPARYLPPVAKGDKPTGNFEKWVSGLEKAKSFFAWVHLADLHAVAIRGSVEEARKQYRERLAQTDAEIGQVLDALEKAGRSGESEVVVVGTHGSHLGEDGARGDSFWLDAATLRVPLVWAGQGAAALRAKGPSDGRKVWLPDVAATLVSLAGGRLSSRAEGFDLLGGASASGSRTRYAWTWATDDQFAWPTLTAVEDADGWRTFDSRDLGGATAAGTGARSLAAARPAGPRNLRLTPEMREKVLDAGVVLGREGVAEVPPPERRNATIEKILALRQSAAQRRPRKTAAEFEELEKSLPENFAALTHRIYLAVVNENKLLAPRFAARLLASYSDRPESLHWAAHAFMLDKDYVKAQALLEATLSLGLAEPEVHYDLACLRALQKDTPGALTHLQDAVDAGYRSWGWIEQDPDLASIRPDPRWGEFLKAHGR